MAAGLGGELIYMLVSGEGICHGTWEQDLTAKVWGLMWGQVR